MDESTLQGPGQGALAQAEGRHDHRDLRHAASTVVFPASPLVAESPTFPDRSRLLRMVGFVPAFSVVIPTHNRPKMLGDAIRSVLSQRLDDFEVIVVDDGSDPPAEIPDDARVRLVRLEPNQGISSARNAGVARSQGRYVAFLDDDDLWLPTRLERALVAHQRAPIVVAWCSYDRAPTKPGRVLEGCIPGHILSGMTPSLGGTSVKRDIIELFDTSYRASEDVEWWIRMARHPVATVPEVGCIIRRHDEPRIAHGAPARIEGSRKALQDHGEFFDANPAAAAFRWKRIGLQHLSLRERAQARRAFARSWRLSPSARTAWHFLRSCRRAGS